MNKSESIKNLAAALVKAQAALGCAIKDKNNPFFKSKYADLSSVVSCLKEPLSNNGLSFVQMMHDADKSVRIETIILHESGEWLSTGVTAVPVTKLDAQGYGSAMTYARRYSLSNAFGVASEDDDGNAAAKAVPQEEMITAEQLILLHDLVNEKVIDEAKRQTILAYFKVKSFKNLTFEQADITIHRFKNDKKDSEKELV